MVASRDDIRRAVQAELDRRGLSDSAAARLIEIDRGTLTRLKTGRTSLETIEKFARALGLDVGEWREMVGHEDWNPDEAFNDGIRQLREEFGVDFQVSTEEIWLARQSPEQIEQMLAAFRARLEQRRKERG